MKVGFFIIGAQKCGTTALADYLRRHTSVQMADEKELHFFDNDSIDWASPDYTRYHSHFDWSTNTLKGEATPIYMFWPNALERLKSYNSAARFIIGLRHPTFRAFSHWRMEVSRSRENLSFLNAITSRQIGGFHRIFSYVERGFYSRQIKRLFSLFPKERTIFYRMDTLWLDPQYCMMSIQRHLNLESVSFTHNGYQVLVDSYNIGDDFESARPILDGIFHDDILATQDISGIDLSDWLDPTYLEPMDLRKRAQIVG